MKRLHINKWIYSYLLSFIAGAGMVFCYAPFSYWPLSFLCILVWFTQLQQRSPKQSFYQGLSFGFGWFTVGISWVHVSLASFGGLPLPATLLLMALLCAYLAIYPAIAAWLSAKLSRDKKANLYLLPFLWLFTEYLRAHVMTGFPWLSLGYSQIDGPLSPLAPIIGEIGITFVLLLLLATSFQLLVRQHIVQNRIIVVLIMCGIVLSHFSDSITETGKSIRVALVQGNIKQELRWDEEQENGIINTYIEMTADIYQDNDIVLWPEAAIPKLEPLAQEYLQYLDTIAFENNTGLITGVINYDPNSRNFFNRLVVLGKKYESDLIGDYYYRNANHYDKHHLLPIGEFVPFAELLRPIAPLFNLPMSSFSRGDYVQQNITVKDINIAPLICFEIAFPQQLAANVNKDTNLLLTVSNDAWFGDSHGPHQHLEIARMRALEFGRPMMRSTNNGITAVIDHNGRVTADIPQFTKTTLQTEISLVSGQTFYGQYGIYLDKIFMLLFFIYISSEKIFYKIRMSKIIAQKNRC